MNGELQLLHEGRKRELDQALFYRFLSGDAEQAGDEATAERLNDLLADEQHHVSRLTARILELGGRPREERGEVEVVPPLDGWEEEARRREAGEVAWYEAALARLEDAGTVAVFRSILTSERHHLDHLAGKWMPAGHNDPEEPS
jgi:rubrerythrin